MNKKIKKIFLKTYGCQMNVFDSERIEESLINLGIKKVSEEQNSDLIILNTCHIREKAAEKVYSELGRYQKLKQKNPKLKIGVIGCVAQAEGQEIIKRSKIVDMVIGPQVYHRLPEIIQKIESNEKVVDTDFPLEDKFDKLNLAKNIKRNSTAFLTIQEGCDKFCSFCVVPYTRGAERSRSPEVIIREASELVNSGVKEITLLGQNVNAYYFLDKNNNNIDFANLIKVLCKIDDLKRLRFVTSHPRDMTENLINLFGKEEKLMPYLHLPIQSGSNKILKKMNRGHTVEFYVDIISKLKKIRPEIAISGDFIVGFPGETDEDFQKTLEICKIIKYSQAYSFKYSPRTGTPSYEMKDIPDNVKRYRLSKLQETISLYQQEFQQNLVGSVQEVLIEKIGKLNGQYIGRTPYMNPVVIKSKENQIGKILPIKICATNGLSLSGEYVI
ncbi:MAG: tRNA (N6-isopentenyl adenosine(37)-C2)-methylthiotransferase MiaB [Paracoccaceae bacterium]